jgi:hypothetical protein
MKTIAKSVLFVAALLSITMVVSCRRQQTARATSAAQTAGTVDYSDHEDFSVWLYADPNYLYNDYSENPVVWALNKKFNVTLKFEQPVRGTERDAMSLMFGTEEYTDMIEMSNYSGSISELYEDGVIVDLMEYLDYMPNVKRFLETYDGYRRTALDDKGRMLTLRNLATEDSPERLFSGLMYRHDILESVTNGNVRFPSGNDYPKTIDDWEYMLPIFKSYFESRGAADYAALIIPYYGYFGYGELVNSFGARSMYYLDGTTVKYGPLEEPYYKYLKKMREWYEKGYIYKDFASRVNDMFFLPNTALTYGGNAGVFYGLGSQVGNQMSNPEYGLNFDIRPIPSPLSTIDGVTEYSNFQRNAHYEAGGIGWAFTAKCQNLPKLLSILDYLYSEEGKMLKHGLTKENGAAENPYYISAGLQDGYYWFENGELVVNPILDTISEYNALFGNRLPGLSQIDKFYSPLHKTNNDITEPAWDPYPNAKFPKLPGIGGQGAVRTPEEEAVYAPNYTRIMDYLNSEVARFIMGTQPLNDRTWEAFKAQLRNLGIEENTRIQQAAYDRWLKR